MQPDQFRKLCKWLAVRRFAASPKFVMTASALLPRRLIVGQQPASALASDGWEGYPLSLHSLLGFLCDSQIKGVVFLSGDEHLSSVTKAHVTCLETGAVCTLHSIHSSGLFSPYPFANGSPEDSSRMTGLNSSFPAVPGASANIDARSKQRFFPATALRSQRPSKTHWGGFWT